MKLSDLLILVVITSAVIGCTETDDTPSLTDNTFSVTLKNENGNTTVITLTTGSPFNLQSLPGTYDLSLNLVAGTDTNIVTLNSDGTGTIQFPPLADNDINPISWEVDSDGVLKFTETDDFSDQWFWSLLPIINDDGNVLVSVTTPVGQLDATDIVMIATFNERMTTGLCNSSSSVYCGIWATSDNSVYFVITDDNASVTAFYYDGVNACGSYTVTINGNQMTGDGISVLSLNNGILSEDNTKNGQYVFQRVSGVTGACASIGTGFTDQDITP